MTDNRCCKCGKAPLSEDENGLTKKLIDKAAVDFFCLGCMADMLGASVGELQTKAEEFREAGCVYFK